MATQVNIHEAKSQLSKLIERAESGEEVVVARAGTPVIRLAPVSNSSVKRTPGAWAGKVWMAADFDETPDDIIDEWYANLEEDG